ncbi:MAG: AMP-binding protein, partial [Campylobacter sp.]|nr:AMP-binding protein [Campylobacter sp.]
TSTFLRIYTKNKKLNPLMFSTLRLVVAGAEKLNSVVRQEFKIKFGIEAYEGDGATETAPVVCINTPNILEPAFFGELIFNKPGSVGLTLPGTIVKIVDPNSYEELKNGEQGLVLIGGSQVMKEYYKNPEKTAEVIIENDGVRYYKSGDIGYKDDDGFLFITDRLSRFAKIGGEMISLGAVESALSEIFKDEINFACANVSDDKKGEKIVMLYSGELGESEINERIKSSKITGIMQPSVIKKIDEIPVLGSGKVNFKALKELANTLSE